MGAPLTPIAQTFKVILGGQLDGDRPWANILHWFYTGTTATVATCNAFASSISAQWASHMAPLYAIPIVLNKVQVVDLSSTTAAEGEWVGSVAGTRSGNVIGGNTAALVSYAVGLRYKGGHPRTYLAAGTVTDVADSDAWTLSFQNAAKAAWDAFLAAVLLLSNGGTTMNTFCAVRYRGKFEPNSGPPHYYLTSPIVLNIQPGETTVDAQMASQRRRIGRVRR